MDIKYTLEGKKVAVVGELNSNQFIVQEISVTESGVELPYGDNFIVDQLLDEPLETWHEKDIKKWKDEHAKVVKNLKFDIAEERRRHQVAKDGIRSITTHLTKLAKVYDDNVFDTIKKFLNGDIKYLVYKDYSGCRIEEWGAINQTDDIYDIKTIKLLSLFGRTDGNLDWKIGQYSDGSGSGYYVIPCSSYEQAVIELDKLILDGTTLNSDGRVSIHINESHIKAKEKYSLDNPTHEQIDAFYNKKRECVKKQLDALEVNRVKLNNQLTELR